jgi:hypothetical protein
MKRVGDVLKPSPILTQMPIKLKDRVIVFPVLNRASLVHPDLIGSSSVESAHETVSPLTISLERPIWPRGQATKISCVYRRRLASCLSQNRWLDGASTAQIRPIRASAPHATGKWHSWVIPENASQNWLGPADLALAERVSRGWLDRNPVKGMAWDAGA